MSLAVNYNIKNKIDDINPRNTAKAYYNFIDYLISSKHRNPPLCINLIRYGDGLERYNLEFCLNGLEKELSPKNFKSLFNDVNKMAGHPYLNALVATDDSYNSTGVVVNLKNTQVYEGTSKFKTMINVRDKDTFSSIKSRFNDRLKDPSDTEYELKYVIPVSKSNVVRLGFVIRNTIPRFNTAIEYNIKDEFKNS